MGEFGAPPLRYGFVDFLSNYPGLPPGVTTKELQGAPIVPQVVPFEVEYLRYRIEPGFLQQLSGGAPTVKPMEGVGDTLGDQEVLQGGTCGAP